ncbi:MAG: bifunctional pyr operon transcriptional regulator/uracil phosphoribosyltransferase PyrR [Oscillospiraceae bacterium]|nr:bifunctional pyr operon transcriptional regulator/uracil phosphoribosyltransferase PyrR [Oscillospiraceae bacterium]
MKEKAVILDESAMNRAVSRISCEIIERNKGVGGICLMGIMSRGAYLAGRIAEKLRETEGSDIPVGTLDITSYRDDVKAADSDMSSVSFDVRGKDVVLVDDVIFTGRSTRAAIDAVMSRGRPRSVQLAVLIDRGHRELPIRPDYVGKNVPTSREEVVKVMVRETDGCDKVIIMS